LEITPYEIVVTYDGTPHGPQNGSNEFWISQGTLPEGYSIVNVTFSPMQTEAGQYFTFVENLTILNARGEDVTLTEFRINYRHANMIIQPREISIETGSLSVRYDGRVHHNRTYEIIAGTLLSGHKLEVTMTASVKDFAEGNVNYNVVDHFVIRDEFGNVILEGVSGNPKNFMIGIREDGSEYSYETFGHAATNYLFTIRYGTLTIRWR
jgi:hypothetical protein